MEPVGGLAQAVRPLQSLPMGNTQRRWLWGAVVLGLGVLAATAASASAQGHELTAADFELHRPPRGTVRDTDGQPLSGAVVQFRVERDSLDAVHWRNHVLRRQPLPQVRTSRDGEFFLPLTAMHRLFTRQTAGQISLVVEKAGYHPWIEPLTLGLRGYLGSEVLLRRIEAADRLEVRVEKPLPGMLLRVHRHASGAVPHLQLERWYPVPASGVVAAVTSFVPSPLTLGTLNNMALPIGVEVQLIHPQRTSVPVALQFGQRQLVIAATASLVPVESVCSLGRADGQPFAAPRGLYRCPDGEARWFPVDPKQVVENATVRLIAIEDRGCLAVNVPYIDPSKELIQLRRIPEPEQRVLELRDSRGKLVENAMVSFYDLAAMPERMDGSRLGHRRPRRRLTAAAGRIALSSVRIPGPGFLFVHARGFPPAIYFDPRQIVGVVRMSVGKPERHGQIELTVTDQDEVPVRGAYVVMNRISFELGAYNGGPLRTDAAGRVRIEYLKTGRHSVQLLGDGLSQASTSIKVSRSGEVVRKPVILSRACLHRVVLVDEDRRPVPFGPVRVFATAAAGAGPNIGLVRSQMRTNSTVCADSRGRVPLMDYPRAMVPRVVDLFSINRQQAVVDESEPVSEVRISGFEGVTMPLPPAPVDKECLSVGGRTVTRSVPRSDGCKLLLVRFPRALPDAILSVYLDGTAPLRLTSEAIAVAHSRQSARPVVIDQRTPSRILSLALNGIDASKDRGFRLELAGLNFRGGEPSLYADSGLRLRQSKAGAWQVALRDDGPLLAWILHPEYRLASVEVGAATTAATEPTEVNLSRGTPVVFRVRSKRPLVASSQVYVYVHGLNNKVLLYQHSTLAEAGRPVAGNGWEVRTPFALSPGQCRLTFRIVGTSVNMPRRAFTAKAGEVLTLDIFDRVVKQVPGKAGSGKVPVPR